jgi:hypothetical protein
MAEEEERDGDGMRIRRRSIEGKENRMIGWRCTVWFSDRTEPSVGPLLSFEIRIEGRTCFLTDSLLPAPE